MAAYTALAITEVPILHFFTSFPEILPTKAPKPASKYTKAKAGLLTFTRYKMSLKSKITSTFTLAFAVVAFATFASAQDAAKTEGGAQKFEGGEHHRGMHGEKGGRHDGMRGGMYGLRGIELTDAQKEQIRQIHEANKPTEAQMAEMKTMHESFKTGGEPTEAQREQMKAFREQRRAKEISIRAQVLAILTPEQRQQLEAQKAEREKRHEEYRQQRQERKTTQDAAKPTDN